MHRDEILSEGVLTDLLMSSFKIIGDQLFLISLTSVHMWL